MGWGVWEFKGKPLKGSLFRQPHTAEKALATAEGFFKEDPGLCQAVSRLPGPFSPQSFRLQMGKSGTHLFQKGRQGPQGRARILGSRIFI